MLKQRAKAFYVLIFAVLVGYFVYSTNAPESKYAFKLGLDLSGGAHLVYKADVSKLGTTTDVTSAMTALRDSVERRINVFGVSEPIVQTQENATLSSADARYKLIVELPGLTDTAAAARAIGATPNLEFRLASSTELADFQRQVAATGTTTAKDQADYLKFFRDTGLDGGMVARASLGFQQTTNQPVVDLAFNDEGRDLFAKITRDNTGYILGIFLDGVPIETPVIQEAIPNGTAQISGGFTQEQAITLVRNINFGALPIPIELISEQTIGPTLGQEAVNGGIMAGLVSFLIIALFMIIWYRLPGFISAIALAIYAAIMLALFKFIPVTLTAAGIAGFIITVGMAVDANILIFERMKEELRRGRSISDAMHEGFSRAWPSIRDSNISSIITGVILYKFGSTSVITGFALVFIIGVLASMFTAITASRLFLYAVAPRAESKTARFLISNGFKN